MQWRFGGIDSLGWVHDGLALGDGINRVPSSSTRPSKNVATHHARSNNAMHTPGASICGRWNHHRGQLHSIFCRRQRAIHRANRTSQRFSARCSKLEQFELERCGLYPRRSSDLGSAYGSGRGWFEWKFPVGSDILRAGRVTVLCEISSCRQGAPQTDRFAHPSALRVSLNGVLVYKTTLPNHPHDARGTLSYLREGRGAYGYLCHITIDGSLLEAVLRDEA